MNALHPLVLDVAVKGTLLLLAAFAVALLLRRSSAAARHLHWQLVLAGLLALPLLAAVTPPLLVPAGPLAALLAPSTDACPPAPPSRLAPDSLPRVAESGAEALRASADDPGRGEDRGPAADSEPVAPAPPVSASVPVTRVRVERDVPRRPFFSFFLALSPVQQVLAIWALGAASVLAMLALGLLRAGALSRRATPITDPAWIALVDRVRRELSLRRVVELRRVPRCVVPMTFGWRRPVVLLPSDADHWTDSRRRHVLLHELAHVRRADWLGQVAAQAACALWWWQPLAWIAARELRRQRELACDDQVLAFGSRASEYADHLLAIAASRSAGLATGVATLAMARRSQLEGRLLAVLEDGRQRRGPTPRRTLAAVAGAAALVAALACVHPKAETPPETAVTEDAGQLAQPSGDGTLQGTVVDDSGRHLHVSHPGSLAPSPLAPVIVRSPNLELHVAPRASMVHRVEVPLVAPTFSISMPEIDTEWIESLGEIGYLSVDDCGDGQSTSIWSWTTDDDSWTVVVKGCVEPDESGTRPAWIDENGSFVIEHELGGTTERVEALPAEDGEGVVWSGTAGGQTLDGDAARSAADRMLAVVLSETALFASQRVNHWVETVGTHGALEEIRKVEGDGSRMDLLRALLTEHELETEDFAAALAVAADSGGSDASLAEVLECIGSEALGDPDLVEPLFKAVESMDSDAYLAEALGCLLQSEYADAPILARGLTAAAKGLESDAYMADLLGSAPAARLRDPAVREAFLAALATVESDAYTAEILQGLPEARGIKGETLGALLAAAAQNIDSDSYLAEVLNSIPHRALSDAAARSNLMAALASIESDAYMAEVAAGWLDDGDAPADFAAAVIAMAAQHVDSDPYLAEVLTASEDLRDDATVRSAVEAALGNIESRAYVSEVREWLDEEE